MELSTGNETVDKFRSINLTGNVIPQQWYKQLTYDSGNAYLLAIIILSDICYWYKPAELRDEQSGNLIGYKKKFKSDFLQRSYSSLADMFGCSKRQATEAIIFLEKKGLIKRHFRTIMSGDVKCSNVLFLELIPENVVSITFGDTYPAQLGQVSRSVGTGTTLSWETNTEITTENTTINNYAREEEKKDFKCAETKPEKTYEEIKQKEPELEYIKIVREASELIDDVRGTNFKEADNSIACENVRDLLDKGYKYEQIMEIVTYALSDWDKNARNHISPQLLFRPDKFKRYLKIYTDIKSKELRTSKKTKNKQISEQEQLEEQELAKATSQEEYIEIWTRFHQHEL